MTITTRYPAVLTALLFFWSALMCGQSLVAGGGPENVFLVYNSSDQSSVTVASHYRHLRSVPTNNLFGLDWRGSRMQIPVSTFRKQILHPILSEIDRRKLSGQIDFVVYSSGFPYAVDFSADVSGPIPKFASGSLTSMTFFYQFVMAKQVGYVAPGANGYANVSTTPNATRAFSGNSLWNDGEPIELTSSKVGKRHLLSAMLAYVDGRGNTPEEVIDYLTRASKTDGKKPKGCFYFTVNEDIRSRTRRSQFKPVVEALQTEGHSAEIVKGNLPFKKQNVAGVMAGIANFKWPSSGSQIIPGAFCDNLTSFGGVMRKSGGQTPLSEFLRYGAAGSSGTIIEPYALAEKFPNAVLHLHYARGVSLGEAFYRSVVSPYQLLLVGDPLCQPWATLPSLQVTVDSDEHSDGTISGIMTFKPTSVRSSRFELYVDGRLSAMCGPGQQMRIDSTKMPDGYHELRVVAVARDGTAARKNHVTQAMTMNRGNSLAAQLIGETAEQLVFDVEATAGDGVQAWCQRRLVGVLEQKAGRLLVQRNDLGDGPAEIQMVAVSTATKRALSFSRPIELQLDSTAKRNYGTVGAGSLR